MADKYQNLYDGPKTVTDFIELLKKFPSDWPVKVSTSAGGGIGIEHRESQGRPFVGIFGKNGGRFGENPMTEEEYKTQSDAFLSDIRRGDCYTSIHGDHRTYSPSMGSQASCYGRHYDRRIVEKMVQDGLISASSVDIDRVAHLNQ